MKYTSKSKYVYVDHDAYTFPLYIFFCEKIKEINAKIHNVIIKVN